MSESEPPSYPPDVHIVRDLAPIIERDSEGSKILLPIVPEILDEGGRPRVGVIATAVDIIAGETAIGEILPQWIATSNLSLHVTQLPGEGTLRARPKVLRKGRTTLVIEVDLDHLETGRSAGLSTIGFSILPSRNPNQARAHWAENPVARSDFALDAAADHYAQHEFGGPARVHGLEIHYLKLARVGPARAEARALGATGSGLLVRVSLYDEGAANALLSVATLAIDRVNI